MTDWLELAIVGIPVFIVAWCCAIGAVYLVVTVIF